MTVLGKSKDKFALEGVKLYRIFPSVRLFMSFLLFLGNIGLSLSFYSMVFGITCMVNTTAINSLTSPLPANKTMVVNLTKTCRDSLVSGGVSNISHEKGTFLWTSGQQSYILSGNGWGGTVMIFIGGILADRFGAKWIYITGLLLFGVTGVITPLVANHGGWAGVLVLRIIQGFCQVIGWPCMMVVTTQWHPAPERGLLLALSAAGGQIGGLVMLAAGGFFCESSAGWEGMFYFVGAFCILSAGLWLLFYTDDVEACRFISSWELSHILRLRGPGRKRERTPADEKDKSDGAVSVPWLRLFFSPPVLAIHVMTGCAYFLFFFIADYMPAYYKTVLSLDPAQSGILSALPSLLQLAGRLTGGPLSDFLERYVSITISVKILTAIGGIGPAICLCVSTVFGCKDAYVVVALFSLAYFFSGMTIGGFVKAQSFVAPAYSGIIAGIAMTLSYLSNSLVPQVVGAILKSGTTAEWRTCFYVASGVGIVGTLLYVALGSADLQPWGHTSPAKIKASIIFTGTEEEAVGFGKKLSLVGGDRKFSMVAF